MPKSDPAPALSTTDPFADPSQDAAVDAEDPFQDASQDASNAPAGRLQGEAARVLDAIVEARLPQTQKDLLTLIYLGVYKSRLSLDDPQWGWVRVPRQELAARLHTTPGDISTRLNELRKLCMIRGKGRDGKYAKYATLRDPHDWDQSVFDWEAARQKHTRPGAGAPPILRDREPPTVPLSERGGDRRGKKFLKRSLVAAHCADRQGVELEAVDAKMVEAHWAVISSFQTNFDEAFRGDDLDELSDKLALHTPSSIIAKLAQIRAERDVRSPWIYLVKCLAETEYKKRQREEATYDSPAKTQREGSSRLGAAGHGRVIATGDPTARSRFIIEADDEDDDEQSEQPDDDARRRDEPHADRAAPRGTR